MKTVAFEVLRCRKSGEMALSMNEQFKFSERDEDDVIEVSETEIHIYAGSGEVFLCRDIPSALTSKVREEGGLLIIQSPPVKSGRGPSAKNCRIRRKG